MKRIDWTEVLIWTSGIYGKNRKGIIVTIYFLIITKKATI
jgi:hypothetical protein